jgi:GNAT superfamily N-acetyltransferase
MLRRLYSPDESLLHPQLPTLLENFPAHLHIDILPEYQGKGRGRALMNAFIAKLRENGVKGIHLIKAVENTASEIFYSKVGFSRYGGVMDGGESGELARISGGRVCMVRKL